MVGEAKVQEARPNHLLPAPRQLGHEHSVPSLCAHKANDRRRQLDKLKLVTAVEQRHDGGAHRPLLGVGAFQPTVGAMQQSERPVLQPSITAKATEVQFKIPDTQGWGVRCEVAVRASVPSVLVEEPDPALDAASHKKRKFNVPKLAPVVCQHTNGHVVRRIRSDEGGHDPERARGEGSQKHKNGYCNRFSILYK